MNRWLRCPVVLIISFLAFLTYLKPDRFPHVRGPRSGATNADRLVLRKQASPGDSPSPLLGTRQTNRGPASVDVAEDASVDRTTSSRGDARTLQAGLSTAGDRQPRAHPSLELTPQTVEGWEHRPATCLQQAPPLEPQQRTSPPCQLHRIVDGDSLPSLAEQYLGDPKRYLEIFHANRRVLSRPDLLPLGVDLRIPR
jgi:hypothetical protein